MSYAKDFIQFERPFFEMDTRGHDRGVVITGRDVKGQFLLFISGDIVGAVCLTIIRRESGMTTSCGNSKMEFLGEVRKHADK